METDKMSGLPIEPKSFEDRLNEVRGAPERGVGNVYINWALNEFYAFGLILKTYVTNNIMGRYTMDRWDGGAIAQAVSACAGDHIEIGSLYGGSAILAALVKKIIGQKGMIYSIDRWKPYEDQTILGGDEPPSRDLAVLNAAQFGVADRIVFYEQHHPPLPEELEDKRFETAFIDGNHMYEGAKADWDNLHERVNQYILFHDILVDKYHDDDCGKVFREAAKHPEWEDVYCVPKMGVLKRVSLLEKP